MALFPHGANPLSARDIQKAPLAQLFQEATRLRKNSFGRHVEFCAIINVKSGLCPMDCRFCAQSKHYDTAVAAYPLLEIETLQRETRSRWDQGIHRVGWVASGSAVNNVDVERIVEAAAPLALASEGKLCASLGQLNKESLGKLLAAGFSRYHHNLETSERFYPQICSTQRWSDRRKTIERAKEIGLEVCSGGLFGLGETWQDRIELAEALRQLDVDSVPINFFCPVPGTPLGTRWGRQNPLSTEEALRIIALFRILLPTTSLRICGGRPTTLGERWPELFDAGAEALMTGDYLTTPGFSVASDFETLRRKQQTSIPEATVTGLDFCRADN